MSGFSSFLGFLIGLTRFTVFQIDDSAIGEIVFVQQMLHYHVIVMSINLDVIA